MQRNKGPGEAVCIVGVDKKMYLFAVLLVVAALLLLWLAFSVTALIFHFIPIVIVGLLAGAIASAVVGSRHGLIGDLVLGLVGSVLGGFLMWQVFHYRAGNFITETLVGIVGAVIILLIGKAFSRRTPRYY